MDGECVGTNVLGEGWVTLEQQRDNFANPIRQMRIAGEELPLPRPIHDLVS